MTNKKLKIGICLYNNFVHSTNWSKAWIEFCEDNNLYYELIDPYAYDIIYQIRDLNILLWHFGGYVYKDMFIARSILYAAKNMGIKIFPDFNDCWHFDDKIAETYLLESIDAPIPNSYMFYDDKRIKEFAKNFQRYPIVAKLRNGSGSHNVKMIKTKYQLLHYARKMFSSGYPFAPSLFYKATSNVKSLKSYNMFINRLKRIPEFLNTLKNSKVFPNEKGYVFLQEFIPNDGYDLKIVVIGNKLSFIVRKNRKGDFRASGGGDLYFDQSLITKDIIDSAFHTSDVLGFNCMGYDYVVNNKTKEGIIVEISYGFSHSALMEAGGYFDRSGKWYDEPLNAPYEILNNMLEK